MIIRVSVILIIVFQAISLAQAARPQLQTKGPCSPVVDRTQGNVTITLSCPLGLTPVQIKEVVDAVLASGAVPASQVPRVEQLSRELGIKHTALGNLFKILGKKQVPVEDLDAKLREIAGRHLSLERQVKA